jgi:hypothetical protein
MTCYNKRIKHIGHQDKPAVNTKHVYSGRLSPVLAAPTKAHPLTSFTSIHPVKTSTNTSRTRITQPTLLLFVAFSPKLQVLRVYSVSVLLPPHLGPLLAEPLPTAGTQEKSSSLHMRIRRKKITSKHVDVPEADAAEFACAVAELADGDAHAGLVLLHPLSGLHVARVADGHGRLVPGRRRGARRVEGRRDRGGSGVEQVEVVRPNVVRWIRHGRGRWVTRRPRRGRRSGHGLARRGPSDRLLSADRHRRRRHHRALPRRFG